MLGLLSKFIRFFLLFVTVFIFVMFAVENKSKIVLSLSPMPYEIEIAKYALILISFLGGYFLAILSGISMVSRQKSFTREFKTRSKALETEVSELKKQLPSTGNSD